MIRLAWCLVGLLVIVGTAGALAEDIAFDRPESWAMSYFSAVMQPTAVGTVGDLPAGAVEISLEGGWVPALSEADRRVGFNGTKVEDLNRTPVFGRVNIAFRLPGHWTAAVGYVPPVELGGARPNVWSVGIGHPLLEHGRWRVEARVHGLWGVVEGDFTCSRDAVLAGSDPIRNPLGCEEPSSDRVRLAQAGAELNARTQVGARDESVELFASLGLNRLSPHFDVRARYAGIDDRTRLETSGVTGYVAGGLNVPFRHTWFWSAEAYFSPLRVRRPPASGAHVDGLFNFRAAVGFRIR